jgi:hypothetical protein
LQSLVEDGIPAMSVQFDPCAAQYAGARAVRGQDFFVIESKCNFETCTAGNCLGVNEWDVQATSNHTRRSTALPRRRPRAMAHKCSVSLTLRRQP